MQLKLMCFLQVGFAIPYFALLRFVTFEKDGSYLTFTLKCLLSKIPLILSCMASMGHLTAISIDRYISLVHPIAHRTQLTKK